MEVHEVVLVKAFVDEARCLGFVYGTVFDVAGVQFVDEVFSFGGDDEDDQLVEQVGDDGCDFCPFFVVDADCRAVDDERDINGGVLEQGGEVGIGDGQALTFGDVVFALDLD